AGRQATKTWRRLRRSPRGHPPQRSPSDSNDSWSLPDAPTPWSFGQPARRPKDASARPKPTATCFLLLVFRTPLLMESDAGLHDLFDAFLYANRYLSSGQVREHASLENAIGTRSALRRFPVRRWNNVDHPGDAELVGQRAEAGRPEGFGERHACFAAFGELIEPAP